MAKQRAKKKVSTVAEKIREFLKTRPNADTQQIMNATGATHSQVYGARHAMKQKTQKLPPAQMSPLAIYVYGDRVEINRNGSTLLVRFDGLSSR